MLNLQSIWINVVSRNDNGYVIHAELMLLGATSKSDRMRFDWKSGGKVVGTGVCKTRYYADSKMLDGRCELEKEVKAKGPITIDVIYIDDQEEKEFLVTTLKTEIRNWKGIGKSQHWGQVPDDLLALAFVRYEYEEGSGFLKPEFQFWTTNQNLGTRAQMRCSVDGKKLPDFDAGIDNPAGVDQHTIASGFTSEKEQRTYTFEHVGVDPGFHFGGKEEFIKKVNRDASVARWLIDNPGQWDCTLRVDGKPFRQFLFTVNDKGMIEPSEMQKGTGAIPTRPNVIVIDMKIPKDNGYELRLRPDALKKSVGFGIPWPDSPKAKELQAAFPPKMGLPD